MNDNASLLIPPPATSSLLPLFVRHMIRTARGSYCNPNLVFSYGIEDRTFPTGNMIIDSYGAVLGGQDGIRFFLVAYGNGVRDVLAVIAAATEDIEGAPIALDHEHTRREAQLVLDTLMDLLISVTPAEKQDGFAASVIDIRDLVTDVIGRQPADVPGPRPVNSEDPRNGVSEEGEPTQ